MHKKAFYTHRWQLLKIQMTIINLLIFIIVTSVFVRCTNEDSTLKLGSGDDVLISLEVLNKEGINKIEFQANGSTEIASENDLKKYKKYLLWF